MAVKHIGFVAHGQIQENRSLVDRMKSCEPIIAVDGGLIHCDRFEINPNLLIGDFDSAPKSLLDKYSTVQKISIDRAKDKTDLEAAFDAAHIENVAFAKVFAALGGRLDHSLYNIYMLFRFPGKVFLETADEMLFAVNEEARKISVDSSQYSHVSIVPFYENARDILIQGENFQFTAANINREQTMFTLVPIGKKIEIQVGKGEVLFILHKSARDLPEVGEAKELTSEFTIEVPFRQTLHLLQRACLGSKTIRIESKNEVVIPLNERNNRYTSSCVPGQTISLIPYNGAAHGITTKGLKWELNNHSMDKGFLGVSNISLEKEFSVQIQKGQLLCIIVKDVIDTEMIGLVDKTSTGVLTRANP